MILPYDLECHLAAFSVLLCPQLKLLKMMSSEHPSSLNMVWLVLIKIPGLIFFLGFGQLSFIEY